MDSVLLEFAEGLQVLPVLRDSSSMREELVFYTHPMCRCCSWQL